jgi:tetratricopeptide (TPR) repeat protein
VSYIYYGTILAFIHARVGTEWKSVISWKADTRVIEQVAVPVVGVALIATLYFVNVPGIRAAGDIIDGFRATTPEGMMEAFDRALAHNSFGNQEIREQLTRRAQDVVFNQATPDATKATLIEKVESELLKQIEEKPGDARAHVFIASFYRSLSTPEALDKAIAQLEIARSLSPKKQQIIFEQGLAYLQKQDFERSLEYFKEAYELDTTYNDARVFYAMGGIATGRFGIMDEVIVDEGQKNAFYMNDLVVQVAYNAKQFALLKTIFEYRIEKNPEDPQIRTNLAYIMNESGDTAGAIEVLKKAGEDIPSFKAQADQFMTDIVKQNLNKVGQ